MTDKITTINLRNDQTLVVSEFIKTQAYIRALAKTLFDEAQLLQFDEAYEQETALLMQAFLEAHQDLSKK